jgi:hypothetical protein
VANGAFSDVFPGAWVENIITTASDHLAISISLSHISNESHRPVQHGFRFEAAWIRAPDYRETMERAWVEGRAEMGSLQSTWSTLQSVAASLKKWGRDYFGAVKSKIVKLECKLKSMCMNMVDCTLADIRSVERELCELFEREEIMARQRSRVDWLKEGDMNTSFFHARASARKRANKIKHLVREDGSRCDDL